MNFDWLTCAPDTLDHTEPAAAISHRAVGAATPYAPGDLESMAIRLAAMQGVECPTVDPAWIALFSANFRDLVEDPGFPGTRKGKVTKGFAPGGTAIGAAAQSLGARWEVVDLGTIVDPSAAPGMARPRGGSGPANPEVEPTMTPEQCARLLNAGRHSAERARLAGARLYIGRGMRSADASGAAALSFALLSERQERLTEAGAGPYSERVVERAPALHGYVSSGQGSGEGAPIMSSHRAGEERGTSARGEDACGALCRLGACEIAALTGAYLACAKMGVPVLIDCFVCAAAALAAERICPGTAAWFIYAHPSAESGHAYALVLEALEANPLPSLDPPPGEGSGVAPAVPILREVCALCGDATSFARRA